MNLDISVSQLHAHWHPIAVNRLIRFIRFYAYPWEITRQQKVAVQQTLKARLNGLQQEKQPSSRSQNDQEILLRMMD